jgi:hypothetical protein
LDKIAHILREFGPFVAENVEHILSPKGKFYLKSYQKIFLIYSIPKQCKERISWFNFRANLFVLNTCQIFEGLQSPRCAAC